MAAVAQAFQPAGSADVPVRHRFAELESPADPQTGMAAPRALFPRPKAEARG
jgi:hypothetical protein